MNEHRRKSAELVAGRLEARGQLADAATVRGLVATLDAVAARLVFRSEDPESGAVAWGSRLALLGPFPTREAAELAVRAAIEEIAKEVP